MAAVQETIEQVKKIDVDQYKYGFETDIASTRAPKGLDESTVRFISAKKGEPEWMLAWRLDAFERWQAMSEPTWAKVHYPRIDFQDLYYYSAPTSTEGPKSLDEVDPELLRTYEKLGIPTIATVQWTTDRVLRRILPDAPATEWTDPSARVVLVERPVAPSWAGRRLSDLDLPGMARVAALSRLGVGQVPTADLVTQEGDVVYMTVVAGQIAARRFQAARPLVARVSTRPPAWPVGSMLGALAPTPTIAVDSGSRSSAGESWCASNSSLRVPA